ncbi:Asp23/Gls24 family envelope stress response protein [Antricoccus suffuscus]|uniref:Asp23/Gls24 family envelope stress response protein n=1 Tax=Antricoccus suffuscus TaxID=1629062 RepID=UPI001EDCD5F5|nr:Asp23/Gls24 family envelope stress response protein [Antricoccus suffuscus]
MTDPLKPQKPLPVLATGDLSFAAGDDGRLTIAPTVVSKVAAIAAREVSGVHSLGLGSARAVTAVRDRIPGAQPTPPSGVSVEVGQTQAAIDIDLIVEYGAPITDIARQVRRQVISAVEQFTGLEVVEVNITVDDINLPSGAHDIEGPRLQ